MPTITYEGREIDARPDESVLDAMLRAGERVAHSCRSGICRCCMMRAISGAPDDASQAGLSPAMREKGFFLPCVCRATGDMVVAKPSEALGVAPARVRRVDVVGRDVVRVFIRTDDPFEFRAGQFVNLVRDDGLARSYSLAGTPSPDNTLEFHVRRLPNGRMSSWLSDNARPGDPIEVRGPFGECHYQSEDPAEEILLVGVGTGLAPLLGVLRDAFARDHRGPITLFHGARDPDGLYLVDELRDLERRRPDFTYVPCALTGDSETGVHIGAIDTVLRARFPTLDGRRAFVCGDPDFVRAMRKSVFLAGASMNAIHSDSFVPSSS
jgi:ferredoxin-NADP reductase/ferredoxin